MKTTDASEAQRPASASGGWAGFGLTDSSWELMHGLEVVEDLPPDAWPLDQPPPGVMPPALSTPLKR